jgi:glucosamine-6-phosphate isomerase
MNLITSDTYLSMSKQAAADILALTRSHKNSVLCTASGDTPAGLYKELVTEIHKNNIDISGWYFVSLDEWLGLNGDDEGSCRFHLNNQLFGPLKIAEDHIGFFDGRAAEPGKECNKVENYIDERGGIDIAILGLGMNGHIGMNEPGTSPSLRSHVTDLDSQTQQIGQKYFQKEQPLSKGITLGLATLLDARHIILQVSGKHKAGIVKRILQEEVSPQLPATLLRNHPGLKIYLDQDAAAFL